MKRKNIWAIAVTAASAILYSACDDSTSASSEPVQASSASDVISSSTSQETPAGNSSAVEETSSSAVFVEDVPPANGCGDLWCGLTDVEGHLETGSKDETGGWWYSFEDNYNGGDSKMEIPNDISGFNPDIFGVMGEAYSGITARMIIGTSIEKPFAGLGFNLVSEDLKSMDVNDWKGVCLTYSSTGPFYIELGLQDEADLTEYHNFQSSVSASETVTTVNVPWSKFRMRSGWAGLGDGSLENYIDKIAAVKLRFEKSSDFLLKEIGSLDACGK